MVKADRRHIDHTPHRLLKVLAVAIVILILSFVTAVTHTSVNNRVPATGANDEIQNATGLESSEEETSSVAMRIDLEEGDVIDLKMARGDVVVDEWEGDDVLVIVEKVASAPVAPVTSRSVNIKVTRRGHNVRIATVDNLGRPIDDPGLSLRIMVPQRRAGSNEVSGVYDLSKLTSVVFKALHRGALKWIAR
jgi:hypothetical protein